MPTPNKYWLTDCLSAVFGSDSDSDSEFSTPQWLLYEFGRSDLPADAVARLGWNEGSQHSSCLEVEKDWCDEHLVRTHHLDGWLAGCRCSHGAVQQSSTPACCVVVSGMLSALVLCWVFNHHMVQVYKESILKIFCTWCPSYLIQIILYL